MNNIYMETRKHQYEGRDTNPYSRRSEKLFLRYLKAKNHKG